MPRSWATELWIVGTTVITLLLQIGDGDDPQVRIPLPPPVFSILVLYSRSA